MTETVCVSGVCPFSQISWLWFGVAVAVVFFIGFLWYGVFFAKRWIKAVRYEKCACGADLTKGEKCTCKFNSLSAMLPMCMQLVASALVGLMYFVAMQIAWEMGVLILFAMIGWMKASILFSAPERKRRCDLIFIDVGYFMIASIVFMMFASIGNCCCCCQ